MSAVQMWLSPRQIPRQLKRRAPNRATSAQNRQTEKDLQLNGPAFAWTHHRSYNSAPGVIAGATGQGNGWLNNNNNIYLISEGANIRVLMSASSALIFTGSGGGYLPPGDYDATLTKTLEQDLKDYDNDTVTTDESFNVFRLYDRASSRVYVFAGFDTAVATGTKGRLVESTTQHWVDDPALTGLKYTYNSSGQLLQITSPTGQNYDIDYTYTNGRITTIDVRNATGTLIAQAEYTYFIVGTHHSNAGNSGDLVQVKVSRKATGETGTAMSIARHTQYRYHPGSRLKAVYTHDGIFRAINFSNSDSLTSPAALLNQPDNHAIAAKTLEQFASRRFTYFASAVNTASINTAFDTPENLESRYGGVNMDETAMVARETFGPGGCPGCDSGSGVGVTREYYSMSISKTNPGQNDVVQLLVEDTRNAVGTAVSRQISALNKDGRMLRDVRITETISNPKYWCTSYKFHNTLRGRVTEVRHPSAHAGVVTAQDLRDFLNPTNGSNESTLNDSSGLIYVCEYNSDGRRTKTLVKKGETEPAYYVSYVKYGDGVIADQPKHLPIERRSYPTTVASTVDPETAGVVTSYAYTFWDTFDTQVETRKTTLPVISTSQNGSGFPRKSGSIGTKRVDFVG